LDLRNNYPNAILSNIRNYSNLNLRKSVRPRGNPLEAIIVHAAVL